MNTKLPAGDYYIGDPCYVIDGEDWMDFLQPYWEFRDGGIFEWDSYEVCAFSTQYGDGSFPCSAGGYLGVDAGMIGAIPTHLCKNGDPEDSGAVVHFDKPFKCARDLDGRLHFGHVEVMTGDEEEENDD